MEISETTRDHKMTIQQDIEKENQSYQQKLTSERISFANDARACGNEAIARAIDSDDGLIVTLNICINSCGFVVSDADNDGHVKLRKASAREAYDRWNWSDITLTTAENLLASSAVGYVDPRDIQCVLCSPSLLSESDHEIFSECMNIVGKTSEECFIYDSDAPVSICFADSENVPEWARMQAAHNCIKEIAKDLVVKEQILVFATKYAYGYKDDLDIDHVGIVKALMRNNDVAPSWFSQTYAEAPMKWQKEALARVGLSPKENGNMKDIVSIVSLWKGVCDSTSVVTKLTVQDLQDASKIERNFHHLGNAIGIDPLIKGYFANIPIQDLILQ